MLTTLRAIERGIDAVMQRVSFLALAAMIGVTTLQIVFRVFFDAISWSEELARYLLVWLTFLGATLAYRRGRHIAVTFLVDALPATLRKIAVAAACVVAAAFFGVLVVVGIRYMQIQSFQVSASMRLPMSWVYAVIPVSGAIMFYYTIIDVIELMMPDHRRADADTTDWSEDDI